MNGSRKVILAETALAQNCGLWCSAKEMAAPSGRSVMVLSRRRAVGKKTDCGYHIKPEPSGFKGILQGLGICISRS
jgi:hypothetical protein